MDHSTLKGPDKCTLMGGPLPLEVGEAMIVADSITMSCGVCCADQMGCETEPKSSSPPCPKDMGHPARPVPGVGEFAERQSPEAYGMLPRI